MGNLCGCCTAPDTLDAADVETHRKTSNVNENYYETLQPTTVNTVSIDNTPLQLKVSGETKHVEIDRDLPKTSKPSIVSNINRVKVSPVSNINHEDNQSTWSVKNVNNLPDESRRRTRKDTSVQENSLRKAKLVQPSPTITFLSNYIRQYANTLSWEGDWASQSSVKFFKLEPSFDVDYEYVEELFNATNKRCFKVTQIHRIQNPYLLAAFLLKKEEMEKRIGPQDIEVLFHGTKSEHIMSICTDNLDWRRNGENIGNKFGQGVSFTPISNYATHYSDDSLNNRIMLLMHVLIGEECDGNTGMVLPPDGFDTTIKPDRNVIVKYEDNEFYPAYKITYCCTNPNELQRRKNNKRGNYNGGRRGHPNNNRNFRRRNYY